MTDVGSLQLLLIAIPVLTLVAAIQTELLIRSGERLRKRLRELEGRW